MNGHNLGKYIMVMRNYYLTDLLVSENSPGKLVTGTCRQSLRKKGLRGEGYKQKERKRGKRGRDRERERKREVK